MTIREFANQLRDAKVQMAAVLEPQTNMRGIVDATTDDDMIAQATEAMNVPLEEVKSLAQYYDHWSLVMKHLQLINGRTNEQIRTATTESLLADGIDPRVIEVIRAQLDDHGNREQPRC
jgi:hypothetical protein